MPPKRGPLPAARSGPKRSTRKPKSHKQRTMRKRILAANNVRDRGYYNNQGVFVPPVMTHAKMNEYLKEWFPNREHANRQDYTQEEMDEVRNYWTEQLHNPDKNQKNTHTTLQALRTRIQQGRTENPSKPKQSLKSRKSKAKP